MTAEKPLTAEEIEQTKDVFGVTLDDPRKTWTGGPPLVPSWCIDHAEMEIVWNYQHIPVAAARPSDDLTPSFYWHQAIEYVRERVAADHGVVWPGEIDDILDDADQRVQPTAARPSDDLTETFLPGGGETADYWRGYHAAARDRPGLDEERKALSWAITSLDNVRAVYPPGAEYWADDQRQKMDALRALAARLAAGEGR